MKKIDCLVLGTALAAIPLAHGAVFVDDFAALGQGAPGQDLNTYNGWTQSETNPIDGPLAWGQQVGSANGFGLGAAYAAPAATTFSASHSIDNIGMVGISLYTTFQIVDSDAAFPYRNDYSIGIYNTGGDRLFSLDMKAANQTVPGGTSSQWNIYYSTGSVTSTAFGGVLESWPGPVPAAAPANYTMSVNFTTIDLSGNVSFELNVTGSNTFTVNSTLSNVDVPTDKNIAEYRVTTLQGTGGSIWGDGIIAITGLAVPEPSSVMLLGLSTLGLLRRRRGA